MWNVLARIEAPVFLWNVFPFHPHEAQDPLSNRPHNSKERQIGEEILEELIILLSSRRLVAIGNDAMNSINRLDRKRQVVKVRHPSYGGSSQFAEQINDLYNMGLRNYQINLL